MPLEVHGRFHEAIVFELSENFAILATAIPCGVNLLEGMLEQNFVFTHKIDSQWISGTNYTLNYFKKVTVPC